MMTNADLHTIMREVSEILCSLDIPHHFTGGIAASFHGEPRLTQDVDVVISISPSSEKINQLRDALSKSFDINEPAMRDAISRRSIFQALHSEHFIKVDFHVGEIIPLAFERSRFVELSPDLKIKMITKEDAILSKLVWISKGSERSKRDVVMMLRNESPIERQYVETTAEELGVLGIWKELTKQGRK